MTDIETVPQVLQRAVAACPDARAVVDDAGSIDYRTLDAWTNRAANLLLALGVRPGDRVALILGNCRDFLFLWFGSARIGVTHVALNARLRGEALVHQLRDCDPALIVADSAIWSALTDDERAECPRVPLVLRAGATGPATESAATDLAAALAAAPATTPGPVAVDGASPLVIMYTSGTTGRPKGVQIPHQAYVRAGYDLARVMELGQDDCMYVCLPLYHGNPQVMGVMPAITAGASIAVSARFSASRFWDECRRFGVTAFTHIGSVLGIVLKQEPDPADRDHTVRVALGGAPGSLVDAFAERFGTTMLDGWGMIEIGCNTTVTRSSGPSPLGQHGWPRGCFEVAVVGDRDEILPVGEAGEIVVRPTKPNSMFHGYFRQPERTLGQLGTLWFHSGDHGRLHRDGSLEFLGREQDAIRRSGENVPVELLEHTIAEMEGVADVAVVGIADDLSGQEILACVVRAQGATVDAHEVEGRDVAAWVAKRLGDSLAPRYVRFCDELPRTASEKVQRFKLRETGADAAWDRLAGR